MNKSFFKTILFLGVIVFSLTAIDKVDAATFRPAKYTISTAKFGIGGDTGTAYNKTIDGSIAYCPEFFKEGPQYETSFNYYGSIYDRDNYVAGQIIKIGRSRYSGEMQYMYISQALNCYYRYSKSNLAGCNSTINAIVNEATRYVNNYKYSSGSSKYTLPSINIKSSSASLTRTENSSSKNATYVSEAITVNGLNNTNYGSVGTNNTSSTKPSYKISLSNSISGSQIKLCTNNTGTSGCLSDGDAITNNGTYYLIVSNAGVNGGSSTFKITGSNSSNYPSSKRWQKGDYQRLVTYTDSATVTRSVSATGNFKYAPAERYSVAITKLDDSGELLPGASLKLFTAADENGKTDTVTLCTTSPNDPNGTCTKTGILDNDSNKYSTGRYICYSESTTPSGYTNVSTHCDPITLDNKKYYYKIEVNGDNETNSNQADYEKAKSYEQGTDLKYQFHTGSGSTSADYTYTSAAKLYKYEFSDGRAVEYKATDEEYKHVQTTDNGEGNEPTIVNSWYIEDSETGTKIDINVTEIEGTAVCYNETSGVTTNTDFCSGEYQYTEVSFSSGNAIINVVNSLNFVNISKKAITGDDEVPGATLSIFKADNNKKCTNQLATAKRFIYNPYVEPEDNNNGNNSSNNTDNNATSGGEVVNDHDTEEGNDSGTDIAQDGLKWVSSATSAVVYGLAAGNYCLQEDIPPKGFKKNSTVVKFSVNEAGEITNVSKNNYDEETKTLIIRDDYTTISISKTDITTTKELPGATLKICSASKNAQGEYKAFTNETGEAVDCHPDLLADGSEATWVSGNEPHQVIGLAAGAYYLIEQTAPSGYTKAESILFFLDEDGVLKDANNNPLSENKLIMYDNTVKVPNTKANIPLFISIIGVLLVIIGTSGYLWIYRKERPSKNKK